MQRWNQQSFLQVHPQAEVYAARFSISVHKMPDRERDGDSTGSFRAGDKGHLFLGELKR